MKDGKLDHDKLQAHHRTAMRMLDNVIDINYYAVKKARDSNLRHRPVGLGVMAFQDSLYELRIPYASPGNRRAVRRPSRWKPSAITPTGRRPNWPRSAAVFHLPWLAVGQGHPAAGHAGYLLAEAARRLCGSGPFVHAGLDALRAKIAQDGMRNSNCVAIAPTATISNIIGVDASIEPSFGNLSVKSNLSGEFTVINGYLVRDLKAPGPVGRRDGDGPETLRRFAGPIDRVPAEDLKAALRHRLRGRNDSGWSKPARGARSGSTRRSR